MERAVPRDSNLGRYARIPCLNVFSRKRREGRRAARDRVSIVAPCTHSGHLEVRRNGTSEGVAVARGATSPFSCESAMRHSDLRQREEDDGGNCGQRKDADVRNRQRCEHQSG